MNPLGAPAQFALMMCAFLFFLTSNTVLLAQTTPPNTTTDGRDVEAGEAVEADDTGVGAENLYTLALKHFEERRWDQAASAFSLALEQDPNPILAYNAARSYEYAGDLDRAHDYYIRGLQLRPETELRTILNTSLERIDNIKKKLGSNVDNIGLVDITSTPAQAQITINGINVGKTPYKAAHPSGPLIIEISRDGYSTHTQEFKLEPGREILISTNLERNARLWTWISLGVGAAMIGGGVWTGLEAQSKFDEAESVEGKRQFEDEFEQLKDDGQQLALTSVILYSVGALATAGAVGLYFYESPEDNMENNADPGEVAEIDILIGPRFLGIGGTF